MNLSTLSKQAEEWLHHLCVQIPTRRLGSEGNRQASAFFDDWMEAQGLELERQPFDCQDWQGTSASLTVEGMPFEVFPSPHSLGCEVQGTLVVAETLDTLQSLDARGKLLLLRGEIAATQLMPTNFPYYYPDEHRAIYEALLAAQPAAILTATARCPEIAGAQYPVQMIEDGNFDIPSVYLSEEEGLRLAAYTGSQAALISHAERIPSNGWNSIASLNPAAHPKVILCAHIDSKPNTPGALDNAAGVITLMLLAELLKEHSCRSGVEIVCMNGEDHYAAKGETFYMETIPERLSEIGLVINLDGLGYVGTQTAYSMYECPDELAALIRQTLAGHDSLCEGEAWYQGDHTMFIQLGLPCVALTTHDLAGIMSEITHTPNDSPDKVDPLTLAKAAVALQDLLHALDG